MFPPYLAGGEGAALISGAAGEHIISARRQLQQAETAHHAQKGKKAPSSSKTQNTRQIFRQSHPLPSLLDLCGIDAHVLQLSEIRNSHTELYAHMHVL